MKKIHIIIGTSAAGIGAAQTLRKLDQEATIICISDEQSMPYNKCFLADYLAGKKIQEDLYTKKIDFFEKNNIQLLLNSKVTKIDSAHKILMLSDGSYYSYDTLFLGTGKRTLSLFPEQQTMEGIFTFHDLKSLLLIEEYIKVNPIHSVIIIGAGLTGVECADALQKYALKITILDRNKHILSAHCDSMSSQFLQNFISKQEINFMVETIVKEILHQDKKVYGVVCENGQEILADMIIVAVGATINTQLAGEAGIFLDAKMKAIITNKYQQTNIETIYAGGDATMVFDILKKEYVPNSLWADAMLQGSIAAHNMAGHKKEYLGTIMLSTSSFFGMQFASCGSLVCPSEKYEIRIKQSDDFYYKYLFHENKLRGFLLFGSSIPLALVRRSVLTQESVEGKYFK